MNNQIYQTPIKHRSRAAEFRLRARIALAGRWWLSIGVLLLFYLLSTVPLLTMVLYESPLSLTMFDEEEYLEYLVQNVVTPSNLALMFMASLICLAYQIFVMAPLQAGYAGFRLGLLDRKPDVGVPELFSCFRRGNRYYWKAVGAYGLYYLILYGIFLVMALVPVVLLVLFGSSGMLVQLPVLAVLVYAFVVIWVLACLAGMVVVTYQYALIPYIVMEYPELGAMDVLRNSRILMKGNKWRLSCVLLSFIGWFLLSLCCTFFLGLVVSVPYCLEAETAFYDEVSQRSAAKEVEFPSINPDDYIGG